MTYELAIKLKKVGFPQDKWGLWYFDKKKEKKHIEEIYGYWNKEDYTKIPLLSELVEECGEGFKGLFPELKEEKFEFTCWMAVSEIGTISKEGIWQKWSFHSGSTPEEAVANLYIQLRSKG